MITKIFEFYKMLNEKAYSIDDTNNCVLLRSITKKELKLCLYNYIDEKIIGYITANQNNPTDGFYIIDRATADKGWGPFMYTLMLYTVYPTGLKPSSTIRPAALNVWKQFLNNPKVKTNMVDLDNPVYADLWLPDVELLPRESPEETKIINTIFKLSPEAWYQPFLIDSDKIIKIHKIDKNLIFKQALNIWQYNYDQSRETIKESMTIPQKDITDKYLLINDKGNTIEFLIQNKKDIFGYAELTKKQDYYQIINVAAESGWGPFFYDTIMSYLDKPVRPNRSLTHDAWTVWNKYCNQRPDVTKKEISDNTWDTVDLDHKWVSNSTTVEPINYLYTIKNPIRKMETINWLNNSNQTFVLPMIQKLPQFKQIRFNQAKKWNELKYNMHLAA